LQIEIGNFFLDFKLAVYSSSFLLNGLFVSYEDISVA